MTSFETKTKTLIEVQPSGDRKLILLCIDGEVTALTWHDTSRLATALIEVLKEVKHHAV